MNYLITLLVFNANYIENNDVLQCKTMTYRSHYVIPSKKKKVNPGLEKNSITNKNGRFSPVFMLVNFNNKMC